MATLQEIVRDPSRRPQVVRDAVRLVEDEVASKSGLSGIAIKAAFKAVQAVKPGLIQEVVDTLLDRFVDRLEPFYKEWQDAGRKGPFDQHLIGKRSQVANALLGVTDERARQTTNPTIKKSYEALRPQGEKHVEAAVPGLARVLVRYVS